MGEQANPERYLVRGKKATWDLRSDLGVEGALKLHADSLKLLGELEISQLRLELPDDGVSLSSFQILSALKQGLSEKGVQVSVSGRLCPFRGRAW